MPKEIPHTKRDGRAPMNVWIDERLYEWVRVESARRRVPIWEIVETALEKYKKDKEGSA